VIACRTDLYIAVKINSWCQNVCYLFFLTSLYVTVSSFTAITVCRRRKTVVLVMTLLINTKHWYSQQQSDPNSDICTSTIPQTVFNIVTGVCILQLLFQRTVVNCTNLCRWHYTYCKSGQSMFFSYSWLRKRRWVVQVKVTHHFSHYLYWTPPLHQHQQQAENENRNCRGNKSQFTSDNLGDCRNTCREKVVCR